MSDHKNALPSGTVLDNRYRLEAVLGAGGFGIVYRASQTHLGTKHAIKEYLPQEIALREGTTVHALSSMSREDYQEGLARFLSEARQLVPFAGHPNIVNCTDFFEANGTAYLVMQYEDGLALDELAATREQNGEPFEEDEIVGLMYPLLRGLQVVHEANVLHRDIKLGNIFIRRADEQPVLLDFGAAKQEFSKHSKSRGAPYTPGYAAPEQVEEEGQLGPWTDIHAVGAVFYRLMAGEVPIKSESRTMRLLRGQADPVQEGLDKLEGEGRFSTSLIKAVRACLAVEVKDRVPSVMELLLRLDSSQPGPKPKPGPAPRQNLKRVGVASAALLLLGLISAGLLIDPHYKEDVTEAAEESTADQEDKKSADNDSPAKLIERLAAEMVSIPAGEFLMGASDDRGYYDEKPVRKVRIESFKMSQSEVTFALWDACMEAGDCDHARDNEGWGRNNRPVININHGEIVEQFLPWLNELTGKAYRLPSESEWEYAARAGSTSSYVWGDKIDCSKANYGHGEQVGPEEGVPREKGVCSDTWAGTVPVGQYEPNAWGLYDTHGNAAEWVQDCYFSYQGAPTDGRASMGNCDARVLRGGSWKSGPGGLRSSARYGASAFLRLDHGGFRLAHD